MPWVSPPNKGNGENLATCQIYWKGDKRQYCLSNLHADLPLLCSSGALFFSGGWIMCVCQEKWQRAYPDCEIKFAEETLSEVGDPPGTSMLRVEHCRGPLGQAWVLAGLAGSVTVLCGTARTCLGPAGLVHHRSLHCSCLSLPTKGNNHSSHCWQQHACPHEDAAVLASLELWALSSRKVWII